MLDLHRRSGDIRADLTREYEAATSLGLDARSFYEAGVAGALCDDDTCARLRQIGESHDWGGYAAPLLSLGVLITRVV